MMCENYSRTQSTLTDLPTSMIFLNVLKMLNYMVSKVNEYYGAP